MTNNNTYELQMPLTSEDFTAKTLAALRDLLPAVFTEGKLDVARLQELLGEAATTEPERYSLNWAGRSEAVRTIQSLSTGTLVPAHEESINFDTSENLILEGDNLEILKLLQKSYHNKVKMIYIDPPYNTGNEFIYPDNFREGIQDYLRYSGQVNGFGKKTTLNFEDSGRYHSKWLSMMYPRLFLAHNLLRDDGIIFVSIDEHELQNLIYIMNEIFGEDHLQAVAKWRRRHNQPNDKSVMIAKVSEFVLVYAKKPSVLKASRAFHGIPLKQERQANYSNPDNDPNGVWDSKPWKVGTGQGGSHYQIVSPSGATLTESWMGSKETFAQLQQSGQIHWPRNGDGQPRKKIYLKHRLLEGQAPSDYWGHQEFGSNQDASNELMALFDGQVVFDNPKPTQLIKMCATIATSTDDIVLDFFAGSGTTAQAVLELNKEDGGNRKFILVQLPEPTDNPELPTIAEITKERVRRVIKSLNITDKHKLPTMNADGQDRGFKVFKLTSSNFKTWNANATPKDASGLAEQLKLYVNNVEQGRSPDDILYELLLKAGLPLTASVKKITETQEFYSIADGLLLVCLADPILPETLAALRQWKPNRVICLDMAFHGNDQLKTNTVLEMKSHGIEFRTV